MTTEKIFNSGVLSGTINASSNLVGGNINTFTKETDPTIPDYIKEISKEDIAGWNNNAVVNEEQNKTLIDLETYLDTITPKATSKGELVHITDALPLPTFETTADGNVEQETTKGKQLFDYKDRQNISTGITTDEDGWITATIDNSNGTSGIWCNFWTKVSKHLKPSTKYKIVLEVKQRTGTFSSITVASYNANNDSQFAQQQTINYADLTNNSIYVFENITKDDFTNSTNMLRSFVSFSVGNNGSITFRLSVLEDTTITADNFVYEKYTGNQASPNPEYPQEIEVLEGCNLFNHNVAKNNCIVDSKTGEITIIKDTTDIYIQGSFVYNEINKFMTLETGNYYIKSTNSNVRATMYSDGSPLDTAGTQPNVLSSITNFGGIRIRSVNGESLLNQKFGLMINKSSYLKQYLPYGHVGYKIIGKNLAKSFVNVPEKTQYRTTLYVDTMYLKPNTTYTIGFKAAKDCKLYFNENLFKWKQVNGTGTYQTYNITTQNTLSSTQYSKGYGWVTIKNYDGNTVESVITDVILVEGIVNDLTYKPYQEQIVPLDLKGNWLGKLKNINVEDNLYTDKKYLWLVKNLKKRVFDGSENWRLYPGTTPEGMYIYVLDMYDSKIGFQTSMCTHFTNKNYAWDKVYAKPGLYSDHLEVQTKFFITNIPTLEEWKAYLKEEYDKGTPVTLVYQTNETKREELGELPEPIKTFEGVNNIQLLANLDTEIEIKYGLDVKKYVDNKYFELTNALVSTGANL